MAKPTEAQRKRSQARERRRGQAPPADDQPGDGAIEGGEEPLEAVKHAAKVAAAGAAVGAAAAAARALASRTDGDEHESEAGDQAEGTPAAEQESPEAEPRQSSDEPAAEAEEAPSAEQESQDAEPRSSREEPSQGAAASEEPVQGASPDEATETVQRARRQLSDLLERPVESVSAFERMHEGWLVTLEVVEVSRIPESTDVLASYEVELDDDRNLRRYARVRRYIRSQADRGDQQ